MVINKLRANAIEALQAVPTGATIAAGGFGLCGIPELCIQALRELNIRNLTVISNNCGIDGFGLGLLLANGQIRKMISSYVGQNKESERQFLAAELEVEFVPQGTLAERLRAGGAGIPAFYTPTGVGTLVGDNKEVREFDGRSYILEKAIRADWAIVKAWRADPAGNLQYRLTARNFNPLCAMAGRITVAEVEELVEMGQLNPDQIDTPGVYVQHVIVGRHEKRIEHRTTRPRVVD